MTLEKLKSEWVDSPEYHKRIHELFCQLVDHDLELKEHRDFVQNNIWGMGERSFWWLWTILMVELPESPKVLEIGCLKGATLSVWKHLRPDAHVFGVTPLDSSGGVWDDDYLTAIQTIHDKFNDGEMPFLFVGLSQTEAIVNSVKKISPFDLVYIDGSHTYEDALFDLNTYSEMVKVGGYLVIDDAASKYNMPFGYFTGIADVCMALDEWEKSDLAKDFTFLFNIVHIMVFQRK